MISRNYKDYLALAVLIAIIGIAGLLWQKPWQAIGSVPAGGNAYRSTSTPALADLTNLCPPATGQSSFARGTLGAINVFNGPTTAGAFITVYDATTTDVTLRAAAATSSLILASIPATGSSTSYHMDSQFEKGLMVDLFGTVGTSTITYRCGD